MIDACLKSEGRLPLREFAAPGQKAELSVGDEVEVYLDWFENAQGEAMRPAGVAAAADRRLRIWSSSIAGTCAMFRI